MRFLNCIKGYNLIPKHPQTIPMHNMFFIYMYVYIKIYMLLYNICSYICSSRLSGRKVLHMGKLRCKKAITFMLFHTGWLGCQCPDFPLGSTGGHPVLLQTCCPPQRANGLTQLRDRTPTSQAISKAVWRKTALFSARAQDIKDYNLEH